MKICITGVIGSGKSAVGHILKEKGYDFFSCDEINSQLLNDLDYKSLLKANFGEILKEDGSVDRAKLGEIIFLNSKKRKLLNSISHPLITKIASERIRMAPNDIFVEIPLLIESGMSDLFDKIWLVLPDKKMQTEIIMKRDNISKELALNKIKLQEEKEDDLLAMATDIIHNDYNFDNLKTKVDNLLKNLH